MELTKLWVLSAIFGLIWLVTECFPVPYHGSYHWGTWSSLPLTCSVTCGRGLRCRVRKCLDSFGNVQSSTERCSNPEDYESKAESCTVCVVHARCPQLPGWSSWGSWSSCKPKYVTNETSPQGCQSGIRIRHRSCNNPPPEPPPFGLPCTGVGSQTSDCSYNCDERPFDALETIAKRIQLQVESDYLVGLRQFRNVKRNQVGERVTLSCNTPAYKLAKRITVASRFHSARKALTTKKFHIVWYKNGQPIQTHEPKSRLGTFRYKKKKKQKSYTDPLLNEDIRWKALLPTSVPLVEDTDLIFPRLEEGDQGLYTCEFSYSDYRWTAIFYSLVVVGVSYLVQSTDPFYLHSNLGYVNALHDAPVWLEASQLVWTLNGLEYSRGLAARLSRRIQYIGNLNQSHHGTWMCFLVVPAIGPFSKVGNTWVRIAGKYLLAEFLLKVSPTSSTLWQLAEHPVSMKVLRKLSVTLSMVCLVLTLFLLLTIWAAKRWISRSLSVDQKKAIIQEIVDNECRLMLTARKRASINKERLLPLIVQENQRLERANRHLTARLLETRVLEEDAEDEETNAETPLFIKIMNKSFNNFTHALKRFGSALTLKSSKFVKRLPAQFKTPSHSEASFKLSSKRLRSRFEIDTTNEKLEDLTTAVSLSPRRRSTWFAKLESVRRKPQPVTSAKATAELGRTYRQRAFSQIGRLSLVSDVSQDSPVRSAVRPHDRRRSIISSSVLIHGDDVK
ncbi:Leucine carboxyl methyltransferase 1 [Paragonimus skrjabini miyazakii]|uniref:Leucine carboxyl methyltransferase 1 n=1 Tax=Paragonimus skrjabini miyazakii TaxID=59628 RepID=A0A8S9Z1A2_9TREM|nr:Leucine carboxyl methyltransferase 1 [Paragonimus skrjabini miyazakii]